ncbi:extracellular solute-binding protein, family 3 [Kordiimonas lacus]|uniref:Extracellular solute-binding protein, family 3 n=2 Tax=Kordiimonas lacus TaxID=637679 RepID=A0A1G6T8Y0_9PROT|nr:extracellular solute-binding protein, family 3 [Kordiimonas lacus]
MPVAALCRNLILVLLAWAFCMPLASGAARADTSCLRMGVIFRAETVLEVKQAAQRIFDRAGLCLELVEMPVRRAEQMVLRGGLDGEILRTALWVEQHKEDVIAVPTPFFEDHMMAISLEARQLKIQEMNDLRPYKVVIAGGHRWAEAKLGALGIEPVKTSSASRYLELLHIGRVDVGLMEESLVALISNKQGIALKRLERLPYYTVLRRDHEALVPQLDAALRWARGTSQLGVRDQTSQ